ncbi:hypothetical protein C8Q80DRAFT_1186465, partial [Daedaleopsis nitida]
MQPPIPALLIPLKFSWSTWTLSPVQTPIACSRVRSLRCGRCAIVCESEILREVLTMVMGPMRRELGGSLHVTDDGAMTPSRAKKTVSQTRVEETSEVLELVED